MKYRICGLFFLLTLFSSCKTTQEIWEVRGRIDKVRLVKVIEYCKNESAIYRDSLRINCTDTLTINKQSLEVKCRKTSLKYKEQALKLSTYYDKTVETYLINSQTGMPLNGLYKISEGGGYYSIGFYFNGTPIHPFGHQNVIEHYYKNKFLYADVFFIYFTYSEIRKLTRTRFRISTFIWDNKVLLTEDIFKSKKEKLYLVSRKTFMTPGEMERIIRNPCNLK